MPFGNSKCQKSYLTNLGNKLADPNLCKKFYWKIVNRVMNRCKAPKIPPLLIHNVFLFNAKKKAHEFIKYFSHQCKPFVNESTLPDLTYYTDIRLSQIPITREEILTFGALIRISHVAMMKYQLGCYLYVTNQ